MRENTDTVYTAKLQNFLNILQCCGSEIIYSAHWSGGNIFPLSKLKTLRVKPIKITF